MKPFAAVAMAMLLTTSAAVHAQAESYFLSIQGLPGTSQQNNFEEYTQINGFAFSAGRSCAVVQGIGVECGVADARPIELTKPADSNDARILLSALRSGPGTLGPKACITTLINGGGGNTTIVSQLQLNNIAIQGLTPSATADGGISQSISLLASQVVLVPYSIDPATGQATRGTPAGWDYASRTEINGVITGACPAD